jgi:hypothetical protein
MSDLSMLEGIGPKRQQFLKSQQITTIEELASSNGLPAQFQKFVTKAQEWVKTHKNNDTHDSPTTTAEKNKAVCEHYLLDCHSWYGKNVLLPNEQGELVNCIIDDIMLEHGMRLSVLCIQKESKQQSSWQPGHIVLVNFDLPTLRITMSDEDVEKIPCMEYLIHTLYQLEQVRNCIQIQPDDHEMVTPKNKQTNESNPKKLPKKK